MQLPCAPLSVEQLEKDGLIQFPAVIGGVVPVVNVADVKPGDMRLTGQVLGDIFLGKITNWNDKAIAELNPKLKLPAQDIAVVRRADGSGTTFIFTNYLAKVNADWKAKVGDGQAVQWPTGIGRHHRVVVLWRMAVDPEIRFAVSLDA